MDGAGQSKGTCQQEGAPQWKIAAVSGAGAGSADALGAVRFWLFQYQISGQQYHLPAGHRAAWL